MSEAVSAKKSQAGRRWLNIATRIVAGVIIFIAAVGFLLSLAGIVGIWTAYAPARSSVNDVAATATKALQIVDNGLGRVNSLVQDARQSLTRVNDEAAKLGNRVQANSPVVSGLSQLVDTDLAPRIENTRMRALAIHDAVVSFNSTLAALDRLPGVTVPTLNGALSGVSDRAQEAQAAVQDLRTTVANVKAGLVTKAQEAVTNLTSKIDAALARIQAPVNKYQASVTNAQAQVVSTRDTILTLHVVASVALTIVLLAFAAGQVLLIYLCWLYVRTGRFPSLRITLPSVSVK
jgi:ElaB/YqjD/DUF883 family membrane-anchored ribosome-binding protein